MVGKVRAFNQEFGSRARVGMRMVSETADPGPYRLRVASDAAWAGQSSYGHRVTLGQKLAGGVLTLLRLIPPVMALLATFTALYLYRDTPVPLDSIGLPGTTGGLLLTGICFFCIALANRRYGPGFAFAQTAIAMVLVAALLVFGRDILSQLVSADAAPPMRQGLAFTAAFFVASFVSIVVFEGARGTRWWTAPLFGFLVAAIVFAPAYYAAAFAGTDVSWLDQALQSTGLLAAEGMLLLIPFWALRGMVQPMAGFGGY
ncbi:MAG: hypothetical protein KGJ78_17135 [Alphaproteobacteria bacterium]|nr:hypothetical protein [Alphaproteobacteria bacterium]